MYVIAELHAAVDMKPGSYVNLPVFEYSVRMSITCGPIVPFRIGNVTDGEPSENWIVAVESLIVRPLVPGSGEVPSQCQCAHHAPGDALPAPDIAGAARTHAGAAGSMGSCGAKARHERRERRIG